GWLETVMDGVTTIPQHRYVYLHVNEAALLVRCQARDRESERGYFQDEEGAANSDLDEREAALPDVDDDYWARLMDAYMAFFCEVSVRLHGPEDFFPPALVGVETKTPKKTWEYVPGALAVPWVVDWTNFGTPESLVEFASATPEYN